MSDIRYIAASDQEILKAIGGRLAALRRARGLTQSEAGERAGLGRNTLYRAEHGDNPTLQTVVRLLRVYGSLEALDAFIPRPEVSPMDRLRRRSRARGGDTRPEDSRGRGHDPRHEDSRGRGDDSQSEGSRGDA